MCIYISVSIQSSDTEVNVMVCSKSERVSYESAKLFSNDRCSSNSLVGMNGAINHTHLSENMFNIVFS